MPTLEGRSSHPLPNCNPRVQPRGLAAGSAVGFSVREAPGYWGRLLGRVVTLRPRSRSGSWCMLSPVGRWLGVWPPPLGGACVSAGARRAGSDCGAVF